MDHKEFRARIGAYLLGDLKEKDLAEFEIHYINCLSCRDYLLLQKAIGLSIKDFIATADIAELEKVIDFETVLKEIKASFKEETRESILEGIKDKILLLFKKIDLMKRIKALKSTLDFSFDVASLAAARGVDKQMRTFAVGEPIVLSIGAPREGHIVVFLYDNKGYLRLIFPRKKGDNTFMKLGEEKRIGMKVAGPLGRQTFKAIFVSRELIKPEMGKLCNEKEETTFIENILTSLSKMKEDEWMEAEYTLQVSET